MPASTLPIVAIAAATATTAATTETRATCCYCGVGCGVLIESDGVHITGVRGDPHHPANFGRLCSKGSTLHLTARAALQDQVRALHPEMRRHRHDERSVAGWDETLDFIAQRFADTIAAHGPDSVAFYVSGQLLTEDYYVFNKLAKGLIGTNNIDSNSRLCMSSAVAGYKQTLGADAPPACYEDLDQAEVIFIVGSNTAFAHPILYRRIADARAANPALKVIVADPRRTDTAAEADLFLPILPGTDVALFNGMLHIALWEGWIDTAFIDAHTSGFAGIKRAVRDYTPESVTRTCGIALDDLTQAARLFATSDATLSLYCQGLNQSAYGTDKNVALINLHLATGQIGKAGAGPFSLTGQPNAMGGREVGGMANLMSGHRDLNNAAHRAEIAALWGVDSVPQAAGKTAVELFDALRAGSVKIVWIVCTNPAQSMPDQNLVREALQNADLVIVQEAYRSTATVPFADVLLPATSWGEKDGSVTNSERRISRLLPAVAGPGQARHDWRIALDFARILERKLGRERSIFHFADAQAIWNEHRATTQGRDLDITGLSYDMLESQGPQQWPFPAGATSGRQRLYEDGIFPTADGRARFVEVIYQPVVEQVDARYPLHLGTGRLRDQWHGMSRTGTVARLFAHAPEPAVMLNRNDMQRRLLADGDLVHVTSRRGSQILPALGSDDMRSGQSFIAMHWGEEYLSGRGGRHGVNTLTLPAFCKSSRQPELKHAAVKVLKADLPWRFAAFGWAAEEEALALQKALRPYFSDFAYASCTLFGRDKVGVLFRGADDAAVAAPVIGAIETLFGIQGAMVLRYDDARRGHARHMRVADGKLQAVALVGDTAAETWLRQYLEQEQSVLALGRLLLMSSTRPPQEFKASGRVICNCFNVDSTAIGATLAQCSGTPDARLKQLQQRLQCGTNCGSCLPELKQMVAQGMQAA